jgi:phytol kinase
LALNQTLFTLMFYRRSRERFATCAYVFLSQDRREDRPDTLIFQVTEDIMRFAVYFPFKLLVVDVVGSKALIFIPIAVNNIGDGLAEPVGVYWGRHKYSTTALYHQGKFFTVRSRSSVTYVNDLHASALTL